MIEERVRRERPGLNAYIESQQEKSSQPVVKSVVKKAPPSKQDLLGAGFGPEDLKAAGVNPEGVVYPEPEDIKEDPPSDMEMVIMEEPDEEAEELRESDKEYYDDLIPERTPEQEKEHRAKVEEWNRFFSKPAPPPTEINLNIRVEVVNTPQTVKPKSHEILNTLQGE